VIAKPPSSSKAAAGALSMRCRVLIALLPVLVAAAGLPTIIAYSLSASAQTDALAAQYDAYFVTAPSCPQCRVMLADIVRTPGIEVWDWSKPGSRAAYNRLRELHGLPRLTKPIVLPLLVTTTPGGRYWEWTGPGTLPRRYQSLAAGTDRRSPTCSWLWCSLASRWEWPSAPASGRSGPPRAGHRGGRRSGQDEPHVPIV
jgi:hypothetical protein